MRPLFFPTLLLCLLLNTPSWALSVLIDPGHGGADHGAVKNRLREASLTLSISKRLARLLEKDKDINYKLSRHNDRSLELKQRKEVAHKFNADLFVSIHANASLSPRLRGVELYFQNILPPDENSNYLANRENGGEYSQKGHRPSLYVEDLGKSDTAHILDDMSRANFIKESYLFAKTMERTWRKKMRSSRIRVKQAPFYVVSTVNMPSLLVEVGYVTNPYEARRLASKSYQNKIANTIYQAIKTYKQQNPYLKMK